MKPHYLAMLAMAVAVSAGAADAGETTQVYRQGNSTATITQSGGGAATVTRRIIHGPNSQTIVQQQGGNSLKITQGPLGDDLDEDWDDDPEWGDWE